MSIINKFGLFVWLVLIACFSAGWKVEYFWRDFVPVAIMVLVGSVCLLTPRAVDASPREAKSDKLSGSRN